MFKSANKELWIKTPSMKNFILDYNHYIQNENVADHYQSNTVD